MLYLFIYYEIALHNPMNPEYLVQNLWLVFENFRHYWHIEIINDSCINLNNKPCYVNMKSHNST